MHLNKLGAGEDALSNGDLLEGSRGRAGAAGFSTEPLPPLTMPFKGAQQIPQFLFPSHPNHSKHPLDPTPAGLEAPGTPTHKSLLLWHLPELCLILQERFGQEGPGVSLVTRTRSRASPSQMPWGTQPGFPKRSGPPGWLIGLLPDGLFPGVIDPISASKPDREAGWIITIYWVENQMKEG